MGSFWLAQLLHPALASRGLPSIAGFVFLPKGTSPFLVEGADR